MTGTEVTVNIKIGITFMLPPLENIWSYYVESMDENLVGIIHVLNVSTTCSSLRKRCTKIQVNRLKGVT
jgi:hypothetical protein